MENMLIDEKEQIEKSEQEKTNFLARMSHEMRTPLNAIIGMATIAQFSGDPEKIKRCLSKIDEASSHLLTMINDILDMAKIEAGNLRITKDEVNLNEMLRRIELLMKFPLGEKNLNFSMELDPRLPEIIISDEQRLTQLITNLLSNAIKFTPAEGKVSLEIQKIDDVPDQNNSDMTEQTPRVGLRIRVSDTGIGFAPKMKTAIFDLFEQVDNGSARKYGGIGLGLCLIDSIVDLMDGKISLESEPGKGSVFTIDLNLEQGKNLSGEPPEYASAGSSAEFSSGAPEDLQGNLKFSGYHMLLAEDVELNREIIYSVLEDSGIQIDSAEDGIQAVEMFEAAPQKYHFILMDINMPEMDGYEATRRIRAIEQEQLSQHRNVSEKGSLEFPEQTQTQIPIIAMTANVFKEDVEKCLASGMNGHLSKPIEREEIIKYMDQYLPVNKPAQ